MQKNKTRNHGNTFTKTVFCDTLKWMFRDRRNENMMEKDKTLSWFVKEIERCGMASFDFIKYD